MFEAPTIDTAPTSLAGRLHPLAPRITLPSPPPATPVAAAAFAGLSYASTEAPGIARRRLGRGFTYRWPNGSRVAERRALARIHGLVIPPAWRNVWICPDADGHIQAIGEDERGRRQYRYHPKFREVRDETKYRRLVSFGEALPGLRARVAIDMAPSADGRRQVLATLVHLLETTMIRVGNRNYARDNHSFGLTTLQSRHVAIDGAKVRFAFKGKSGKAWRLDIRDRRIVRILKTCQELPGQSLFRYVDAAGAPQAVTSADVNDYLREVSGADVTAKDFRTWNGTVLVAAQLAQLSPAQSQAQAKRNLTRAIGVAAARLGNTPPICRQCYVHPAVVDAYLAGRLHLDIGAADDGLSAEETAVLGFLKAQERA